jgi:hypothetical protein
MSGTTTAPVRERTEQHDDVAEIDVPWVVIVWNDPVNLMSYVTFVFQKLFGYSKEKATKLTATLDRGYQRGGRWTVELSEEEALAWLGVLNDVRLTLGVRLEVTDDLDGDVDPTTRARPGSACCTTWAGWRSTCSPS